MASIYVFCTSEELLDWIQKLCMRFQLGCISFRDTVEFGVVVQRPSKISIYDDTYRMFLWSLDCMPQRQLTMNDVNARGWGWVDIRPGHLRGSNSQTFLLLSEIHGEDFEEETIHPARFVRWLRRQSDIVLKRGVIGKDLRYGGESVYRDIGYTKGAYDLFCSGVEWKQFPDVSIVFEPLEEDD